MAGKHTPFIRRIPQQGGAFYIFSSAAEDLTLSFDVTTSRKFKFSKLPNEVKIS